MRQIDPAKEDPIRRVQREALADLARGCALRGVPLRPEFRLALEECGLGPIGEPASAPGRRWLLKATQRLKEIVEPRRRGRGLPTRGR